MQYYSDILSGITLKKCYDIAPSRIKQYFKKEIDFVISKLHHQDHILEMGCGYGRVVFELLPFVKTVIGIDTSGNSLRLANTYRKDEDNCEFMEMDATGLTFKDNTFDVVVCIQNGINAFRVDKLELVKEAYRVLKPNGIALFSSYLKQFWFPRLQWFELQAEHGLIGEIDYGSTGNGTIICKDGLKLGITDADEFRWIGYQLGIPVCLTEVDNSSLFCEFFKDN